MARNYIGLASTGHDGAVAIIGEDGELRFAEATERPLQSKRALNSPPDLIGAIGPLLERHCDPAADLVVATTWGDQAVATIEKEAAGVRGVRDQLRRAGLAAPLSTLLQDDIERYLYILWFVSHNIPRAGRQLREYLLTSPWSARSLSQRAYPHHLTHAAAACFTGIFDEATCAVIDGFGEGTSCRFYEYRTGTLKELATAGVGEMSRSLGLFYARICRLCGFDSWLGEEWKVMGLASYGRLDEELHHLLRQTMRVDGLRLVQPPEAADAQLALHHRGRPIDAPTSEAADMAFTGQLVFSELMRELLTNLSEVAPSRNLVLTGGCALNSSWNGRILAETDFDRLHVFPAPGDDGNAVGAALLAYYEDHPDRRPQPGFQSPYLGSRASPTTLTHLGQLGRVPGLERLNGGVPQRAARLLADGKIIGWMQGRAEFGPRALGNRSILADPRAADMKDRLNDGVKFREPFRPFAPSVLHEFGPEYFEDYQESPYMERTLVFRPSVRERVPAVVHEDGTGRLQTVKREWNERFYLLIEEFRCLTGVPLVLNTSFNVMGKPIIHTVEDAVAVFFSTGLDALVIEDYLIQKPDAHRSATG